MNTVSDSAPIFVMGAPRSGTTLLVAMLGAHSKLSCGPETRFFHFLNKTESGHLLESWPEKAVDFVSSMVLMDPVCEHYGLTREQIYGYLEGREPSVPAILASVTEQFMLKGRKARWIEKSPEHLRHVNVIREHFPYSPIIRIMRDPRDAALSMNRTPWAPQDFLEALLFWRNYDEASASFFESDDNCYTLKYEDLLRSPKNELAQVCEIIGEAYEERMVDTAQSAANVATAEETWKSRTFQPVDTSRIEVWRRRLTPEQNRHAEALIGDRLHKYGYECSDQLNRYARVYPSIDLLLDHRATLKSFVDEGVRFWQGTSQDARHSLVFIGEPDRDGWLTYRQPDRWWETLHILGQVATGKLSRRPIYWVRSSDTAMKSSGKCSRVLAGALKIADVRQVV